MSPVTVTGCGLAGKFVLATCSMACWALAIDWAFTCSLLATRRLTVDMLITARANMVITTSMIRLTTSAAPRWDGVPIHGFATRPFSFINFPLNGTVDRRVSSHPPERGLRRTIRRGRPAQGTFLALTDVRDAHNFGKRVPIVRPTRRHIVG